MSCWFFYFSSCVLIQIHRSFNIKTITPHVSTTEVCVGLHEETRERPRRSLGPQASPPTAPWSIIPPSTTAIGLDGVFPIPPAFPCGIHQLVSTAIIPPVGDDNILVLEAEIMKEQNANRDLWDDEQWSFFMQTLHEEFLKGNPADKGTIRLKDLMPIVPRMQEKFTSMKTITTKQLQCKCSKTKTKHHLWLSTWEVSGGGYDPHQYTVTFTWQQLREMQRNKKDV